MKKILNRIFLFSCIVLALTGMEKPSPNLLELLQSKKAVLKEEILYERLQGIDQKVQENEALLAQVFAYTQKRINDLEAQLKASETARRGDQIKILRLQIAEEQRQRRENLAEIRVPVLPPLENNVWQQARDVARQELPALAATCVASSISGNVPDSWFTKRMIDYVISRASHTVAQRVMPYCTYENYLRLRNETRRLYYEFRENPDIFELADQGLDVMKIGTNKTRWDAFLIVMPLVQLSILMSNK